MCCGLVWAKAVYGGVLTFFFGIGAKRRKLGKIILVLRMVRYNGTGTMVRKIIG